MTALADVRPGGSSRRSRAVAAHRSCVGRAHARAFGPGAIIEAGTGTGKTFAYLFRRYVRIARANLDGHTTSRWAYSHDILCGALGRPPVGSAA
jgi:hypothetical protein